MPRNLKRRSDAISRDEESPEPEPSQRPARRRSSSASSANSSADGETQNGATEAETSIQNLSKKLVRLALSSEYSRLPLRRNDITQKIFKESNASHRLFKPVLNETQRQLRNVFGMELFELPSKEKTSLKDRRTQATQTQTQNAKASQAGGNNKSWILVSVLPQKYKTNPTIAQPAQAPTQDAEAQYTGLYTFILSLVYLNNSSLPEAKLERYLKRVNADTYTQMGTLDKVLARMAKEGYLEKRRDTSSGEDLVEYVIGPRGKVEVGIKGVAGLVKSVYGFGAVSLGPAADGNNDDTNSQQGDEEEDSGPRRLVKMEKDELEKRLARSLGAGAKDVEDHRNEGGDAMEVDARQAEEPAERPRRGRRRRDNDDD